MQAIKSALINRQGSCLALAAWLVLAGAASARGWAQQRFDLDEGQWIAQKVYDPQSPQGRLQTIRKQIAGGNAKAAWKLADRWIKQNPDSPLLVEAHLLRGDALTARQRYYSALFDYELIAQAYPAAEQYHTALEREYEIASRFVKGLKRRFLGMRILTAEGEGEELLIRIQERSPGSEVGHKASLTLADYYYSKGKMIEAAEAYDLFLINYPDSQRREWALLRLIQASLARFKGPEFDPTGLIEAQTRLRLYVRDFPVAAARIDAPAYLVRIEQSLARQELIQAKWYQTRNEKISAAYLYGRLIEDHPTTAAAREAAQQLALLPRASLPKKARLKLAPASTQTPIGSDQEKP